MEVLYILAIEQSQLFMNINMTENVSQLKRVILKNWPLLY